MLSREVEPPVGTWAKDRHGGTTMRQPDGWGEPGVMPYGRWVNMWDARGPYVECGPWGGPLPSAVDQLASDIRSIDGDHSLGAGALAEKLVELGWLKQACGNRSTDE